ncbi:MAG: aspartate/glutamate racemase family protein [Pseudomonadota bacterium]
MHIGLIGGIGPAATDFYYRGLIAKAAAQKVNLDLTIAHADTPTLLTNMTAGDVTAQSDIYHRLTKRLQAAGADCVVITSISGHFPIDRFEDISPLPVINLLSTLRAWLQENEYTRVGLLGTNTVMRTAMHGKLSGIDVVIPESASFDLVHQTYVDLAMSGVPTQSHRDVFFAEGEQLVAKQGAQAILLGGTDLNVAFEGHEPPFDIIDCAGIHVDAIAAKL